MKVHSVAPFHNASISVECLFTCIRKRINDLFAKEGDPSIEKVLLGAPVTFCSFKDIAELKIFKGISNIFKAF